MCKDLGEKKIKWDDYKDKPLPDYLAEIHEILKDSNEMPKVRHRHKFVFWGNDTKSKTDGRWLMDFIDDSKKNEVFEKEWGKLGNNDEKRKEYLIKCAKPGKQKELAKLLKYKGNLKDLFKNENTVTPPPAATSPVDPQKPPVAPPQQQTQKVVPQTTTPQTPVEKYNPALSNEYANTRERLSDDSFRVPMAINKFIAKLFWPEEEYKRVFNDDIARNNLMNRPNTNNRNINN